MNFAYRGILVAFAVVAFSASILAYGPLGHEIVGAIADERLANTPAAAKVCALLDGLRLEKAALIADEIKGWDKRGVDDPRSFHYSAHRNIDRQLRDFWRANQPTHDPNSPAPSHHSFHYTDVPVFPAQRYRAARRWRTAARGISQTKACHPEKPRSSAGRQAYHRHHNPGTAPVHSG